MTGTMREIIWIAGSLPVWIALNLQRPDFTSTSLQASCRI